MSGATIRLRITPASGPDSATRRSLIRTLMSYCQSQSRGACTRVRPADGDTTSINRTRPAGDLGAVICWVQCLRCPDLDGRSTLGDGHRHVHG